MLQLAGTSSGATRDLGWFVSAVEAVLDRRPAVPIKVKEVAALLEEFVRRGDWLAEDLRRPVPDSYARYLLHRDRENRFVVLSLVWLPGQATPIHDHECWGVMGLMEGSLEEVLYERLDDGARPDWADLRETRCCRVEAGTTAPLVPPYHEIHRIGNPYSEPAVSIHVYGRDLDKVHVFDLVTKKVSQMRIKYYNTDCGAAEFAI